jgi:hypothetical protein
MTTARCPHRRGARAFGIVWTIDLFNFMDGLGASEAIFMAAHYLGYIIAVLALASATRNNSIAIRAWLTLGGVFSRTRLSLLRRLLRGESIYVAHRSCAYQWLARRWGSHGRVTGTVIEINLVWWLPWSVLTIKFFRNRRVV